jgi:hypothetical protein
VEFPLSRESIDKIRLGIDNNRLSSLLAAILDAVGGEVTLTKQQAEREWESPRVDYEATPDGGIKISLRSPSH